MNMLLSFGVPLDKEYASAGHTFLGAVKMENGVEGHVWLKKGEKLKEHPPYAEGKKLDAFQMDQELHRLRMSIDLSCVEDNKFLQRYIALLDTFSMQQAATLEGLREDNREIWESNERISAEFQRKIDELKAELRGKEISGHPGGPSE